MILIPLPLFGASTVFSTTGFTVWVVIGIIWTFCSAFAVVLYPLWESREALIMISKGMIKVWLLFVATGNAHSSSPLKSQDIFAKGSGKFVPADAKEEVPA
jgi:hypothetical protein